MQSQFTGKDPDARKDWGQEETGVAEDEMVGQHHWLDGYEFEQTLGDSEGPGSLACCSPRGLKELDITTKQHYCSPTESVIWGMKSGNLYFTKVSWWFWNTLKFVNHWSSRKFSDHTNGENNKSNSTPVWKMFLSTKSSKPTVFESPRTWLSTDLKVFSLFLYLTKKKVN